MLGRWKGCEVFQEARAAGGDEPRKEQEEQRTKGLSFFPGCGEELGRGGTASYRRYQCLPRCPQAPEQSVSQVRSPPDLCLPFPQADPSVAPALEVGAIEAQQG